MCILFSGIDSLTGTTAIQLVDTFKLKAYGGVALSQTNELFYADFDTKIDTSYSVPDFHSFIGLLGWFGLKKIKFRIDRAMLRDTQVDFQIHLIQEEDYITIPKVYYGNR